MLTSVIPGMFVYKAGRMKQFMHRTNQPVAKAALVHEKQLPIARHTYLARTCRPGSDDHVVDGVAVGRDEGDAGGSRCDVVHCLLHFCFVLTENADS